MTTTWKIFDTKYQKVDGLITKVTYGCTVQLENYIDRTISEIKLTGNTSIEGFVPYSNLSEEVILGWVKTSLGAEAVTSIETSLQNNVTVQKAAKDYNPEKNGLPWSL